MNFDFDNFSDYLTKEVSVESVKKIKKLNSIIKIELLNDYERQFIDDVKAKIISERKLTDRQKKLLANILQKCSASSGDEHQQKGPDAPTGHQ
jgi:hypothetical protein